MLDFHTEEISERLYCARYRAIIPDDPACVLFHNWHGVCEQLVSAVQSDIRWQIRNDIDTITNL